MCIPPKRRPARWKAKRDPGLGARVPPEPAHLRLPRLPWQTRDLDQEERPAHNGASTARIPLGMLAMGLGRESRPRPHAHGAILWVLEDEVAVGREPGVGRIPGELVTVTTWPVGARLRRRIGVEAAPGAQADENGSRRIPQGLGE
jgi:hypothetical protein